MKLDVRGHGHCFPFFPELYAILYHACVVVALYCIRRGGNTETRRAVLCCVDGDTMDSVVFFDRRILFLPIPVPYGWREQDRETVVSFFLLSQ